MDVTSVEFSKHALEKIRSRRVLQSDVLEAIRNPESLFDDVESDTRVALKQIRGKYLVAIFVPLDSKARVITVYHATEVDRLISRKLERGAWRRKT